MAFTANVSGRVGPSIWELGAENCEFSARICMHTHQWKVLTTLRKKILIFLPSEQRIPIINKINTTGLQNSVGHTPIYIHITYVHTHTHIYICMLFNLLTTG